MDATGPILELGCDQVDLWYVLTEPVVALELESEYRALLPANELAACDRFVFPEGRRECLITRMLIRSVLSSYTGDDLSVWKFSANRYGKPSIAHPADCPLRFNLSHTTGLVVCAVSPGADVGVDAEDTRRRMADESIAQHYFAPEEVALLEAAPPDDRPLRFLQFWTLKEAFLKAHGSGLSIPLKDFSFELPPGRSPKIYFHNPGLGDADRWQFLERRLGDRFQLALAIQRPIAQATKLRMIETIPQHSTVVHETTAVVSASGSQP